MRQETDEPERYIVDPEKAEEADRLRVQGRYFDAQLGLLPKQLPDLTGPFDILDIGCASGGWACEVANSYRSLVRIQGIDISENMIQAAKARVIANNIPHVQFSTMDATIYPFAFPNASFDFIHARAICAFMQTTQWPALVQECFRLLRPGGYVCFVESDAQCWTSSQAIAEFYRLGHLALYANGNSWDKEGIGIMTRLPSFLRQEGFELLANELQGIPLGQGTEGYRMGVKDYKILLKGIIPLCTRFGIATQEELEALYIKAMEEVLLSDYNAFWIFSRIVGKKA